MTAIKVLDSFWISTVCIASTAIDSDSGTGLSITWINVFATYITVSSKKKLGIELWAGKNSIVSLATIECVFVI